MKGGSDTVEDGTLSSSMTSQEDFRCSAADNRCVVRSRVTLRGDVHSIYPPSAIVDDDDVADLCAAKKHVENHHKTVEQSHNGDVPPYCTPDPLFTQLWAGDSPGGAPRSDVGPTSACTVEEDHGALKFHFVYPDKLSGGVCSSSVPFQLPEWFSKSQQVTAPIDVQGDDMVPLDVLVQLGGPSTPLGVVGRASTRSTVGSPCEGQPVVTVSTKVFSVELRKLKTTESVREETTDASDDDSEGQLRPQPRRTSWKLVANTGWQPGYPTSFQLVCLVGCGLYSCRSPSFSLIH